MDSDTQTAKAIDALAEDIAKIRRWVIAGTVTVVVIVTAFGWATHGEMRPIQVSLGGSDPVAVE